MKESLPYFRFTYKNGRQCVSKNNEGDIMTRFSAFSTAVSIALFANFGVVGVVTAKPKVFCKDCAFPLTISCKASEEPRGGVDPFPFKCNISQRPGLRPIKSLQCEAIAGGDNPFPFQCAVKE